MKKFLFVFFIILFAVSSKLIYSQDIVIDGQKDAFYDGLTGPDDGYLQLKHYACNDNGAPINDADLSAKMWAAWDATWFYFYTEVKDNIISGKGGASYQSDGIEFKFDPIPTSTTNSIFAPQLTILDTADADQGVVNGWDDLNNIPDSMKQYARRLTSDGYAMEVAIKWDAIVSGTEKVSVAVDSVFGLALNVHDNDNLQATPSRDHSVMWAAHMADAVWNTPAYLGTVKFLADHKVQFIAKNNITGETNPIPFDGTPFYINVDAAKDWVYNVDKGPSTGYLQIKSYAGNDNGFPTSDADLSANVWTAWDASWFYLYTEVKDNVVTNIGSTSYFNDGIELKIDPEPTDSTQGGESIFAPNLTALSGPHADSLSNIPDSLKKWARKLITGGYALELAIKWSAITAGGETIDPAVDNVFGLAMNVHDNDENPNARVASIMWGAVMKDAAWNTPKYLGTIKFLADNRLDFIPTNNMTGVTNPVPYDGTALYISVDAKKDPFYNSLTGPSNGYLQIRSYAWNDNGIPTDDADLSAKVWTAWDASWFYLYTEVKDDIVTNIGSTSYFNDGIELKIDPLPTDSTQGGNSIFAPNLTALSGPHADSLSNIPDSLKKWARARTDSGYALELAIKWSAMTVSGDTGLIVPKANNVFGLAMNVHDNDTLPNARVASIMWGAVMLDAAWNTPKYLGTVKFASGNKLNFIAKNNMTGVTNPIPYDGSPYTRTGVKEEKADNLPIKYDLSQNYPNPFNPTTTIKFSLAKNSDVKLVVYDILGRVVTELVNGNYNAGYYNVTLNASYLSSGVYFYRLEAGSYVSVKKLILMK
jgi:hypothetical protein